MSGHAAMMIERARFKVGDRSCFLADTLTYDGLFALSAGAQKSTALKKSFAKQSPSLATQRATPLRTHLLVLAQLHVECVQAVARGSRHSAHACRGRSRRAGDPPCSQTPWACSPDGSTHERRVRRGLPGPWAGSRHTRCHGEESAGLDHGVEDCRDNGIEWTSPLPTDTSTHARL